MKKIFSFVIVLAAIAMVSCGGNTNSQAAEETVVEEAVVETAVVDSTACCKADSTACQATEAAAPATK